MHRGMSYRKPAPVYVPSPPTSPAMDPICPTFVTASTTDQSRLSRSVAKEKPLPILPATNQTQNVPITTPLASSARTNIEPLPVTRQTSKARTTSSGAWSTLNYCSDSENTVISSVSVANSRCTHRTSSQRSRGQTSTLTQQYRPPTPPRQTERRRFSKGYKATILHKDNREPTRASTCSPCDGGYGYPQEPHSERHQLHGPRASKVVRAESLGTSRSCMTERTQFSMGVSERSMAWTGGLTVVATTEGYPKYPVLPTFSHTEIKDREMREPEPVGGFELIHSSFWDKMGMWVVSLKARSKHVLRGCCL
ncbi:hypothetical protein AN958_05506 [Leucoagaricus sp. SymC.cos]|nr:hypothetical protein AN958_05506 [Leucoagaricus sp. SymC.cos]